MLFRRKNNTLTPRCFHTDPPPPPPPIPRHAGAKWGPVGTRWGPGGEPSGDRWEPSGNRVGTRWEPGGGQVRWEPLVPTRSPLGRVSRRGIKVGTRLGSGKQAGPNVVPTWSPLAQLCPHVVHTWSPHGPHVVPNWSPHGPHVVPIVATWSPSCSRQGQCQ